KPASVLLEKMRSKERRQERQKQDKKHTKRVETIKRMTEKLKTILELLEEGRGPVPTHNVWQASIHRDNIDAFYAELKELLDQKKIEETKRNGRESFLKLAPSK